jgi:predicted PurR-regulated permease PerM
MDLPPSTSIIAVNKKFTFLEILQYTLLVSTLLYFGKALFIPLSFAMLISFILYPICKGMEKNGINKSISILITILLIAILLGGVIYLLFSQLMEFSHEWKTVRIKLFQTQTQLSVFLSEQFGVSLENQSEFIKKITSNLGLQVLPFLRSTAYSFSESIYIFILTLVFSSLILFHRQLLANALYQIFPSGKRKIIHEILIETIHAYYNFIKGMLLVYLIVGILNSIGLAIIGVPHPFLFGFIASILTFIPYVGIMIASLLPIMIAWIEFNSIWYPLAVVLVFTIVQLLEAYIIFPFAVGGRLKINTLVVIIMIVVGGIIWGAAGMILFIPFVSILKLIADRTESLKTLSILLGDGNLTVTKKEI